MSTHQAGAVAACVATRVNSALLDYFRCPTDYAEYLPAIAQQAPASSARPTFDFDPAQKVEELRRERYPEASRSLRMAHPGASGKILHRFVRAGYYAIRPILPIAVRRHLQNYSLRGWEELQFPHWPVDTSVEQLMRHFLFRSMTAQRVEKVPFIWFWPEGYQGGLIMTHDVETRRGLEFCSQLMDLDASFGIRSSFQIIPERRYRIERPLLDLMRARGFEVNVHDLNHDGNLFRNHGEFLRRAVKINSYAVQFSAHGFRSAALFRNLDWLSELDFSYDMSVPNVGHLDPQPGGCCTVMPYFIGEMLELPLTTTQDYSLFHILQDYSLTLWKQQIERIQQDYGLISFNVHPDYVISKRARQIYTELLAHLQELGKKSSVWMALPGQIDAWWRTRRNLKLVQTGDEWRVDGKDSERARIAWAVLDGERLAYEFS